MLTSNGHIGEPMVQTIEELGQQHTWGQTRDDWFMSAIPINTPAEAFGEFASIVQIWRSKTTGGLLPDWTDYELQDFEGWYGWYGWYAVFDVVPSQPLRLKCRLWGAKLAALHGHDLTGKTREVGQHGYDQHDDDFGRALINETFIGYDQGEIYWQNRKYICLRLLTLPLAADGVHIDKLLHIHIPPAGT